MSDRQTHRTSLLLALAGAILMLAAASASLQPAPGLPNRDTAREPVFDLPRPPGTRATAAGLAGSSIFHVPFSIRPSSFSGRGPLA